MKTLAGGGELRCIPDIKMSKTSIYCIQTKNSQCKKMLKKKSQKTVEIESRNVVETDTTSLCLLNKPTYRQNFRGRRRFNCVIMRKKLTPIFRQISDAATPKLVKRMAEISPVHSLLDKLLEGSRRRIQAASLAKFQQLKHHIS